MGSKAVVVVVVVGVCDKGGDDWDLNSCSGNGVDACSSRDIFVMSLTASSIQSPISFSLLTLFSNEDCVVSSVLSVNGV